MPQCAPAPLGRPMQAREHADAPHPLPLLCARSERPRCRLMPRTRPGASILHCDRDALHAAAPPCTTVQSTGSFSASARPPRCHSRSTRTCFATPEGSSSPTMAMTPGPCSTTSGTRTFSTRSGIPNWRRTGSRTFGEADLTSGRLAHLIGLLRVQQGSVAPSHLAPCLTRWRRQGWHRLGRAADMLE